MEEYREVRNRTMQAVADTVEGPKETVEKMAEKIADAVMDAIAENYRSITEVHSIVEAVRAGHHVQIAYADADEYADPCIVKVIVLVTDSLLFDNVRFNTEVFLL